MKIQLLSPIQKGGPLFWAKNLAFYLNLHNIDVNHTHDVKNLLKAPLNRETDIIHTVVPLFFSFFRKPLILTMKGDVFIEKLIWRGPYYLAIKNADIITTPSFFLKEKLKLRDAIVIPNAICPNNYQMITHVDKQITRLVTVTNFSFKDKSQGILDIIKILSEIQKDTDKQISYTIVGGGKYLEKIKKISKNYSLNITFSGYMDKPEKILEMNDIFLYYSSHDNFPNVFLEAMASGLPIVTNNIGAVSEIIENSKNGFISQNDDGYKKHLIDLIDDSRLRAKIGKNARMRVEQNFDWNKVVLDYITIYNQVMEDFYKK